jgi:hypothetical protein
MNDNELVFDRVIHVYPNGKKVKVTMPSDDFNWHSVAAQLENARKGPGERVYIQTERGDD